MTMTEDELKEFQELREAHKKLKDDHEKMKNERRNENTTNDTGGSSGIAIPSHDYAFDERWAEIDKRIELAIIRRTNENKQYAMRKNILLHKVKGIPRDRHGYDFNKWCTGYCPTLCWCPYEM